MLGTYSKVYDFQTGFQQWIIWCRKALQNLSGFKQLSYSNLYDDDGVKKQDGPTQSLFIQFIGLDNGEYLTDVLKTWEKTGDKTGKTSYYYADHTDTFTTESGKDDIFQGTTTGPGKPPDDPKPTSDPQFPGRSN